MKLHSTLSWNIQTYYIVYLIFQIWCTSNSARNQPFFNFPIGSFSEFIVVGIYDFGFPLSQFRGCLESDVALEFKRPYLHTLSVLRIFVHSISNHFQCQKLCNSNFFVKSQHSLLDFCHLTNFFQHYWVFMTLNPIFSKKLGKSWRGLNV